MISLESRKSLKDNRLFAQISFTEFSHILSMTNPAMKEFVRGAVLVQQNESLNKVGILLEGTVFSEKYHVSGKSQIVRVYKPKDLIGLEVVTSRLKTSPTVIISKQRGHIVWLSYEKLFDSDSISISTQKKLWENISGLLADENVRLMNKTDILSHKRLRDKILTYLNIVSERQDTHTVTINMNQRELANYLCVDRSALSFELNALRREGFIDFTGNKYTVHPNELYRQLDF